MVTGVVQGTPENGFIGDPDPALLAALTDDMPPLRPSGCAPVIDPRTQETMPTSVGTRAECLLELAGIKAAIRSWFQKDPDQVMREASAYSARCTELWTELRLIEEYDRDFKQVRTMQVDPVLQEIGRQYEFAKSRVALMRQEIDTLRGT